VKSFDVIVVGAGIIGVCVALELRNRGFHVLVLDRNEPGREASHAGAGMLAARDFETPAALRDFALASAQLYPEFVQEIASESGEQIDFRQHGTIYVSDSNDSESACSPDQLCTPLSSSELMKLEPVLAESGLTTYFLLEDSVDPRSLFPALLKVAKMRGVEVHGGSPVTSLVLEDDCVRGVTTTRTQFSSSMVINCCGAWAAQLAPVGIPTHPVKGHMLSVIPARKHFLKHVVRSKDVYLVPRNDGHIVIGSTIEAAGFDKRVDPDIVQRLHQLAANLVPEIGEARIHEVWTGLRPGTADGLPIIGRTSYEGYFAATGHYRNGILLAPITARVMAELISGMQSHADITRFLPQRFSI
jgi:glycine oxidase